jgi:hypothetical protein
MRTDFRLYGFNRPRQFRLHERYQRINLCPECVELREHGISHRHTPG